MRPVRRPAATGMLVEAGHEAGPGRVGHRDDEIIIDLIGPGLEVDDPVEIAAPGLVLITRIGIAVPGRTIPTQAAT